MMTEAKQNAINDFIIENAQRKFDPMITKAQITNREPTYPMSWGARNWGGINDEALCFIVNGRLHQGIVIITLGWMDTYNIHLFEHNGEQVGESTNDIYEDQLVYILDELIETPRE